MSIRNSLNPIYIHALQTQRSPMQRTFGFLNRRLGQRT
jgi:hypothetical protein